MNLRILTTFRAWLRRRTAESTLAAATEVAFTAVIHPHHRPWDQDSDLGPDIPGPRTPAD